MLLKIITLAGIILLMGICIGNICVNVWGLAHLDYVTHKSIAKESRQSLRIITFSELKTCLQKDWWRDPTYKIALFGPLKASSKTTKIIDQRNMIHAGTIIINNQRCIFKNHWEYDKAMKYLEKHIKDFPVEDWSPNSEMIHWA